MKKSYRQPASELAGVRTFVDEKSDKGIPESGPSSSYLPSDSPKSDKYRAKPLPSNPSKSRDKHIPQPAYNAPGSSQDGNAIKVRTPSTPGAQYGHPYIDQGTSLHKRRTMQAAVEPYQKIQAIVDQLYKKGIIDDPIQVRYYGPIGSGDVQIQLFTSSGRVGFFFTDRIAYGWDRISGLPLNPECKKAFRKIKKRNPDLELWSLEASNLKDKRLWNKGIGKLAYEQILKDAGSYGAVVVPHWCRKGGSTSGMAQRVWDSLKRRYESEGPIVIPKTLRLASLHKRRTRQASSIPVSIQKKISVIEERAGLTSKLEASDWNFRLEFFQGYEKVGFFRTSTVSVWELENGPEACRDSLRKLGNPPLWVIRAAEWFDKGLLGKGLGVLAYEILLDYVKSKGGVVGPDSCSGGSTSNMAQRVWASLKRRYESEGPIIIPKTLNPKTLKPKTLDADFPKVLKMSLEEFQQNPPPNFVFSPRGHYSGKRVGTEIHLGPSFFRNTDLNRRWGLLYHELGHDLTLKLRFNDWWLDVMEPFRIGSSLDFENDYGFSTHPSEVLADAYAALVVHNGDRWWDSDKHKNLMARIRKAATRLGLPLKKIAIRDRSASPQRVASFYYHQYSSEDYKSEGAEDKGLPSAYSPTNRYPKFDENHPATKMNDIRSIDGGPGNVPSIEKVRDRYASQQKYEEVQSDLFMESGVNWSTSASKINSFAQEMKRQRGWGGFPPIHGVIQTFWESDLEDYEEALEGGYEYEIPWSRPPTREDIGISYVAIEDGHNRAYAARKAKIPIRVRVW